MPRIDRERPAVLVERGALHVRLGAFLRAQAPVIAGQLHAAITAEAQKVAKRDDLDAVIGRILQAIQFGDWAELVPDVEAGVLRVLLSSHLATFAQIAHAPLPAITEQVHAEAVAWARARAAELVGMRRVADGTLVVNPQAQWAITDSTRAMLRADVVAALEAGTSTQDLAAVLEAAYAFSDARAETIARTEVGRADIAGSLQAYAASGEVDGKRVLLGSEHDPDDVDECVEAARMGVVPLDSDFDGRGDPLYHPRCVCDLEPVLAPA